MTDADSLSGREIRIYRDSDFDGVDRLWRRVFPDDPPRNAAAQSIPRKLAFQGELFFVATSGAAVIGTVMAGYDGHRGWLYSVAVDPDHRRAGIGKAMVRQAERALRDLGCNKINLQVRERNASVVAFYESLGYSLEPVLGMGRYFGP
ncbi:MAG: GNAT family acetyltransferase [Sphingomonas sp.]|nr:GNAT family acetyltransferase [Sphingomonas sp.]|tara:strand:+ start:4464 stop:4907 length:444 start_codon:yes stop_codon:yes gene_type:complete